ncbi:MAG: ExbD/TolR family protein [Puniceicoccaceae bacterium]
MKVRRDNDENLEIQMAPLIDCMFILLIFFLVTTTLKKVEKEVPITLPFADASIDVAVPGDLVVLSVDAAGQKYFRGEPVSTAALLDRLQLIASENAEQRIRIDGDEAADYRHIIEIIEALKFYGLRNIGFHTRPNR